MTTIDYIPAGATEERREDYLNISHTIKSWLFTLDHKRIGILYLITISFFFVVGGIMASLVRLELATPQGDLLQAETYNKVFTMHGVYMVFFFLIPSIPATLGNFLIPLMIGARDVAFPRLNLMSWYCLVIGAAFVLVATAMGGIDTGWTFYTPYSSVFSNTQVSLAVIGIFINGFSSILTGLNFVVTMHKMRCPGLTWFRMPLFLWSLYATSLIQLLGTPVIAITLALTALERLTSFAIFDPARGGDPVLFQHLFWFYSHPAVYIMILPGFGVISEIIATFSRHRIVGYHVVAFSSLAIATVGFLVWGHHMFVTGQSVYAGMIFSFLSFFIGIPTAIKVFNWTATLYKGSIWLTTPMYYALFFIGLFTIGGLTGLFLSTLAVDIHLHDTYFVVAHFHYVMVGGMVLAYLAGLHYWWPKMTGKMYVEWIAKFAAFTTFVGFNLTFFPQFLLGYLGMPRRYHAYPEEWQVLHVLSSAGASVLALGLGLPIFYLLYSLWKGEDAGKNPWGGTTLEWETDSPPITENFTKTPVVTREAYQYYTEKEPEIVG